VTLIYIETFKIKILKIIFREKKSVLYIREICSVCSHSFLIMNFSIRKKIHRLDRYMNRFQMFPTFSRFRVFQVMCITDAIISFSLCVYLIFLRDFSAVVHSGNGGDALLYKSIQPASRYLCHFRGFLWVNPFMYDMHARFAMRKLCECSIRVAPLRIMFRKSVQTALEVVNRDNRIITIVCLYCVKLRLNQL